MITYFIKPQVLGQILVAAARSWDSKPVAKRQCASEAYVLPNNRQMIKEDTSAAPSLSSRERLKL